MMKSKGIINTQLEVVIKFGSEGGVFFSLISIQELQNVDNVLSCKLSTEYSSVHFIILYDSF